MKLFSIRFTTLRRMFCGTVLIALTSCATQRNMNIPGFGELKGKEETRQSVRARHGAPLAEETFGASHEYQIVTYSITNSADRLLLLFYKDAFLAASRELPRGREFIERTARAHSRHQDGKVILFRSWHGGTAAVFVTTRERMLSTPRWAPRRGTPAPLSEAQAEAAARAWLAGVAPDVSVEPKVRGVYECMSVRDTSFYLVGLGVPSTPAHLREVVVLMDGSVVPAELEEDK